MNLIEYQNNYETLLQEKRVLAEKIRDFENWENVRNNIC